MTAPAARVSFSDTRVHKHVTVCVCTYKRPFLLQRLLNSLASQEVREFGYSIVVVDNDGDRTAERTVQSFASQVSLSVIYHVERRRNIALARNAALSHARGEYAAFIDDDEYAERCWLFRLLQTCEHSNAAGVLGPVIPYFERQPPDWIRRGGFFNRSSHSTGHPVQLKDARTGNLLLRRTILERGVDAFSAEYGTGGEDVDFFRRMMAMGHQFVWCGEAPVYECVPWERCNGSYLLRRALLRGRNAWRHPTRRLERLLRSSLAVPAYAAALPILCVTGREHVMKYTIKLCDHLGLVLASVGLSPINERDG